jgi:hypothetical protein
VERGAGRCEEAGGVRNPYGISKLTELEEWIMAQAVSSIRDQVRSFVAEIVYREPDEILSTMNLLGDFGLDGDDADEFMIEFAKRFDVDMSGYEFLNHFGTEGIWPWQFPRFLWNGARQFCGADPHEMSGLKPITVEDLCCAAKAKKWQNAAGSP